MEGPAMGPYIHRQRESENDRPYLLFLCSTDGDAL